MPQMPLLGYAPASKCEVEGRLGTEGECGEGKEKSI